MRLVGGDDCFITLIDLYPCTGGDQLTSREQWYIYEKRPALNYLTYTFTTPAPVVEPKVSELLEDANDKAIISELTAKVAMLEQKLREVSDYTPTEATTVGQTPSMVQSRSALLESSMCPNSLSLEILFK